MVNVTQASITTAEFAFVATVLDVDLVEEASSYVL
eukprot:CAMPEP_0194363004 /NCGR_PEP_ID=MMETSP0174-20130528/10928_1 /TAXON_ID=216777 /ORGANISM="Proboscia alata, Strain PI-D3" /LENGTH=34 /DNA_ID= /DNA_START= /DNA_END= /DNA_ORIENTATION=